MSRWIDLDDGKHVFCGEDGEYEKWNIDTDAIEERKTGQWIDGQCSLCGCDIPAYIVDWKWQKDMDANFCPNCGAKMEVNA